MRDPLGGQLGYGRELDPDFYHGATRVLVLSDGVNDTFGYRSQGSHIPGAFSIGERLAAAVPDIQVTQTDFNIDGISTVGNLTKMHLDSREPFPFEDDSFDIVVLRKGLCLCYRGLPCAGFSCDESGSQLFFSEVIRVLNKKNPNAVAILHGQERNKPKTTALWRRVLEGHEARFPIRVEFRYAPAGYHFISSDIFAVPQLDASSNSRPAEFNSIWIFVN